MEKITINHELKSVLAKRIAYSTSMTGAIIYGGQRLGKTSYALQIMCDIYGNWTDALRYTFFKLEDFIFELRGAIKDNYLIPCVLLDDASVGGSKQIYFSNKSLAMYISALGDVMGTSVKGLLMTTPNPDNLLKSLRGYEFYRIKITKANAQYDRIATGYKSIMLPSGTRLIKKEFQDKFNAIIPDNEAYSKYSVMRKSYLTNALDNLERVLNEKSNLKEQIKDVD